MESFLSAVRTLRDCINKVDAPQVMPNAEGARTAWTWVDAAQQSRTRIREGLGQFLQSVAPPHSLSPAQWGQTILQDVDGALVAMRRVIALVCREPVPAEAPPSRVVPLEEAEELRKKYQDIIQRANKVGFADTNPLAYFEASYIRDGFKHLDDYLPPIGHDPKSLLMGIPELDDPGMLYEALARINHRFGEVLNCAECARAAANMIQQKMPKNEEKEDPSARHNESPPIPRDSASAGTKRDKKRDKKKMPPRGMTTEARDICRRYKAKKKAGKKTTLKAVILDYIGEQGGSFSSLKKILSENPQEWKDDIEGDKPGTK